MFNEGDGRKPKRGDNSRISVPAGLWGPRKIFLSSKMMNYQLQHMQKQEILEVQKIKYDYKSKNQTLSYSIKSKNAPRQEYLL